MKITQMNTGAPRAAKDKQFVAKRFAKELENMAQEVKDAREIDLVSLDFDITTQAGRDRLQDSLPNTYIIY